jgi:hypothetical protein
MDDKIVLICATGRSGSTTIQRLINTIPKSNICGENLAAINSLLEFYRRIKQLTFKNVPGHLTPFKYEYLIKKDVKPSWYNSYDYNSIVHLIKITIINMFKNSESTNIWGFKEIRYDSGNINYIKDFKELFPQTKVIIHIRENIQAQSKSGWFKKDKNAIPFLNKTTKELIEFSLQNKEWCFYSTFERMFDKNYLRKLFNFIECGENFNEQLIDEILKNNIKD